MCSKNELAPSSFGNSFNRCFLIEIDSHCLEDSFNSVQSKTFLIEEVGLFYSSEIFEKWIHTENCWSQNGVDKPTAHSCNREATILLQLSRSVIKRHINSM